MNTFLLVGTRRLAHSSTPEDRVLGHCLANTKAQAERTLFRMLKNKRLSADADKLWVAFSICATPPPIGSVVEKTTAGAVRPLL